MARDNDDQMFVGKPSPDIYLALLIITTAATVLACMIMWFENAMLSK